MVNLIGAFDCQKVVLSLRPSTMDDNLYDEFGVYLGPDLDDDDVASDHEMEAGEAGTTGEDASGFRMDVGTSRFEFAYACRPREEA